MRSSAGTTTAASGKVGDITEERGCGTALRCHAYIPFCLTRPAVAVPAPQQQTAYYQDRVAQCSSGACTHFEQSQTAAQYPSQVSLLCQPQRHTHLYLHLSLRTMPPAPLHKLTTSSAAPQHSLSYSRCGSIISPKHSLHMFHFSPH